MISAIIPVGNFIKDYKNINNIVRSTRKSDIELIIVDDSDTHNFHYIMTLVEMGNQYLRIVRSEKKNPGGARNIGLEYATGESVIFWDSDDHPDIKQVLQMSKKLLISQNDFVVGGYTQIENGSIDKYNIPSIKKNDIIVNPGIWRILFKKKSIINMKFTECSIGEDQLFMADIFDSKLRRSVFNENVYFYKKNQNSLTRSPNILENYKFTLEKIESQMHKKSRTYHLVYSNLLLSYIKRNGIRNLKKSIKILFKAIFKHHLTILISKILISKMILK